MSIGTVELNLSKGAGFIPPSLMYSEKGGKELLSDSCALRCNVGSVALRAVSKMLLSVVLIDSDIPRSAKIRDVLLML